MIKDETYYFHQTPPEICKELIKFIPNLTNTSVVFEPFAGEDSWINALHEQLIIRTEIQDGTDYKSINLDDTYVDWVISNPPFKLEEPTSGRRMNSFYKLCEYFAGKTNKGFAFLGNDYCFSAFTPKRLKHLYEEKGVYMYKVVVCNIKKWRGRYFFIIFKNKHQDEDIEPTIRYDFFDYLEGSF